MWPRGCPERHQHKAEDASPGHSRLASRISPVCAWPVSAARAPSAKMPRLPHLALLSLLPCFAGAAQHAVLIAGSDGYENYRHQADVAHAYAPAERNLERRRRRFRAPRRSDAGRLRYTILTEGGVPAENIVTFMYARRRVDPKPGLRPRPRRVLPSRPSSRRGGAASGCIPPHPSFRPRRRRDLLRGFAPRRRREIPLPRADDSTSDQRRTTSRRTRGTGTRTTRARCLTGRTTATARRRPTCTLAVWIFLR